MSTWGKQARTVRIARWSATHPWWAIGLWILFVVLCFVVGGAVGTNQAKESDTQVGESGRAVAMVQAGKFDRPAKENVLITARSGKLDTSAARAAAQDVRNRLGTRPEAVQVGDPVTAHDGSALLIPLAVSGNPDTAADRIQPLLDQVEAAQRDHPQLRIEEVGGVSLNRGINAAVGQDLGTAELLSLPVTLLIMLIAFGAVIAAGVPVLLAISAVGSATGLSALSSHVIPSVGSVDSVILLMGMAVGVDYSLFYLKREREERQRLDGRPGSKIAVVEIAAATAGHTVVVSGIAVIVSMAALYLAGDTVFSSLATGSIIVVAVAMLGSLTVLPALLAKLGSRLDRPRVPVLWRLTNRQGTPRLWPALLRPAVNRPGVTLLVSTLAMIALALPALNLTLRAPSPDILPRSVPVVQALDRLTHAFPGEGANHTIAAEAPPERAPEVRAALEALVQYTKADPLFASGSASAVRTSADGRVSTVDLVTPHDQNAPEAVRSLSVLREDLLPVTVGLIPGVSYAVGGDVAGNVDSQQNQADTLPWVIGAVLLLTFLVMMITFRSVVLALSTVLLNALSAGAAFGMLTAVFQHHWAESLLGFRSTGAIVSWVPLFVFVVLVGLSMDYHVFVVSRIREAAQRGMPTREAVRHGITNSAGVVTSAAIVMVSVFSVFVTLSMIDLKEVGFGLAAAVLLDAVIIRVLVLPSLMALLGQANWWPSKVGPGARPRRNGGVVPGARPATPVDHPRPKAVRTTVYMVVSWFFRTTQFVLIVTGVAVGVATAVVGIGIPVLLATASFVRWSGDRERGWVRTMLDVSPAPARRRAASGLPPARRWLTHLTDPSMWRELAYLVLAFPLASVELGVALIAIVLSPIGAWVMPRLGWLHGQLAIALLGREPSAPIETPADEFATGDDRETRTDVVAG
ncbi:membrane protein [Amycolatopsis sp. NBRC 101858]|uniref:MMPL family transporter n=1 Tax=Amycolatopsis sp. NBRC 101858 TaxID=3032200 RepID=UPI0024A48A0B|nr:MMPL family transporter [Amycolatopsis sp. NBRC 101858]GLY42912.1 membrane protein [Amycolatopsis sp. NBRC 101858]